MVSTESRINRFGGTDMAGGRAIDPAVTEEFNQAVNNVHGNGKSLPASFVTTDLPRTTDKDPAPRADGLDSATPKVMLAQYAPAMPGVPFLPLPPSAEATRGTPQNDALTKNTIRAGQEILKILDKMRHPADFQTAARRAEYIWQELASFRIPTLPVPHDVDWPNIDQRTAQSGDTFDKPVGFPGTPLPPPPPMVTPAMPPMKPEPIGGGFRPETLEGINIEALIPPRVDDRLPGFVPPEMPADLHISASADEPEAAGPQAAQAPSAFPPS
jgi:hypothetical protein